jgi:PAS domain S-box-containing protein
VRLANIQRDRLGLSVMLAALVAVVVVLVLTVRFQLANEAEHIRAQGVNLARMFTKLSDQQRSDLEQVMNYQLSNESFAYGVIAGEDGFSLVEVAAPGVTVPLADSLPGDAWVQETSRETTHGPVIEFYGPILVDDRAVGQNAVYRIGFFQPSFDLLGAQLPFIASLMLPVFLLVPLFLFFLRREVDPLKNMTAEFEKMLAGQNSAQMVAPTPGDIRGFARQFNHFLDQAKSQIVEYKEEQSKLVTSEKFLGYRLHRFEAILNSLPVGLLVLDQDACVSLGNEWLHTYLGLDSSEIVGKKLSVCAIDTSLQTHFAKHERNLSALVGEPFQFDAPNGEMRLSASVHRMNAEEETASSFLVMFLDVSNEARAQQTRKEFVAHLAHELKAPLHTLSLYSEMLQNEEDNPTELQLEATNVISDEVERLARLINNLLSMTKIEMGTLKLDRQRVKLIDLVRDTTESLMRNARDKELTFELDLPNDVIPVLIDKNVLRIAISNLLTNAIKYSDAGGTVTVSVNENDDAVTICVADTGIGIPQEAQAEIFEKFYRVEGEQMNNRSGHGLGLALARQIVELHHGSMRVESELGEGSRFYIDLWKQSGVMQQAI